MTFPSGPHLLARLEEPPTGLPDGWVLQSSGATTIVSSTTIVTSGVPADAQGGRRDGHGWSFYYAPAGPFVAAEAMQARTPFIHVHVVESGFGAVLSRLGAPEGFHLQLVENGAEDVVFAAPTTVAVAELEAFVASISGDVAGAADGA